MRPVDAMLWPVRDRTRSTPAPGGPYARGVAGPELSRRQLLGSGLRAALAVTAGTTLGGGAVAVADYFDQRYQEHTWEANATQLTLLDRSRRPVDEAWVVVPGFGNRAGKAAAKRLDAALSTTPPVAYLTYSDQGTSLGAIRVVLQAYSRYLLSQSYRATLSLLGESMGAPAALAAAAGISVPIRRIVLSSSPFDMSDARLGGLGRMVARSGYRGGVVGAYFYNLFNDIHQDGLVGIPVDLVKAGAEVGKGPPPRLWASQVRLMQAAGEVLDHAGTGYAASISSTTHTLYCGPRDPGTDHTVDEDSAAARYQAFFTRQGAGFDRIRIPYSGHADTDATLTDPAVRTWLRRTNPRSPYPHVYSA